MLHIANWIIFRQVLTISMSLLLMSFLAQKYSTAVLTMPKVIDGYILTASNEIIIASSLLIFSFSSSSFKSEAWTILLLEKLISYRLSTSMIPLWPILSKIAIKFVSGHINLINGDAQRHSRRRGVRRPTDEFVGSGHKDCVAREWRTRKR